MTCAPFNIPSYLPRFLAVTLALHGYLLMNGCEHQSHGRLRIGMTATPAYALLHIASHRGFFTDEHVDVTMVMYRSNRSVNRGLFQGEIDLGCVNDTTITVNYAENRPQKVYTQLHSGPNSERIIYNKKSGVKIPAQITRATIATTNSPEANYFFDRFSTLHGLSVRELRTKAYEANDFLDLFRKGVVNAALVQGPQYFHIEKELGQEFGGSFGLAPYQEFSVLYGRSFVSETQKSSISRVLKALFRANKFLEESPEEAKVIVKTALSQHYDPSTIEKVLGSIRPNLGLSQYLQLNLDEMSDWLVKTKIPTDATQGELHTVIEKDLLKAIEPRIATIF